MRIGKVFVPMMKFLRLTLHGIKHDMSSDEMRGEKIRHHCSGTTYNFDVAEVCLRMDIYQVAWR